MENNWLMTTGALIEKSIPLVRRNDASKGSDIEIGSDDVDIVSTMRGQISLAVKQDWELPAGLIFIPFCFAEAPANFLTNPQLDPVGKVPEFKFCAARIGRMEESVAA